MSEATVTAKQLSEDELFLAYATPGGYLAQCACGGWIEARSSSGVAEAIRIHGSSREHEEWRCEQLAVEALQRKAEHPCPCHGGDV